MNKVSAQLGKSLTAQEVAETFNLDVKTVRKYYQRLGGFRVGRLYKFFEEEVVNAIQKNRIEEWEEPDRLHRSGEKKRTTEGEEIQNQKRGLGMGSYGEECARRELAERDTHNIFG